MTLADIAQDVVDYLAYGQRDSGVNKGGWTYTANSQTLHNKPDNSITGYAVMGLSFAEQ